MRVERLGGDKVRFFLSLGDLTDRGIVKEDMWSDIPKVHELFNDMMDHAYQELGFEVAGPVAVEVFALPAQGMVVIVTRGRSTKSPEDVLDPTDVYELEVTMEETDHITFCFPDFENLVQASHRIKSFTESGGQVYAYQKAYYLLLSEESVGERIDAVVSLLSEYGVASTITDTLLQEYGKVVFEQDAINQITKYFGVYK
ncbi:genetic competence negative regulator [Hazenella sp. IB182357]|uniref:Genetic competence negative regulator n=1 Tax=Polycladospora coralii TaxID=2771432 RepID=A0A926N9W5_9BACL|nr:genetic competence negative regulator [Polycladospora coralii]MBD1371650.1 genetic competence negative regulator [Polycladospora coralii]MBS7529117.1 genetic competence negative regulator [Polycladospora coralii]